MSPSTYSLFDLRCNTSFLNKKNLKKIEKGLILSVLSLNLGFRINQDVFILGSITCCFNLFDLFQFYFFSQGLILLACLALLAPSMAAPAPTFDPITAASFTAAGGLVCIFDIFCVLQQHNLVSQVLTASSGATLTVPTAAILAGKAVAIKGLLLKTLAN